MSLIYALTCMKVYYGESTHQLLFSHHREPKQDMTYIIVRTNFNRLEELLDYKSDLTRKNQGHSFILNILWLFPFSTTGS